MPTYVRSSVRATTPSNPCPDGTSIGYETFNDTIFLICDAAFYKVKGEVNIELALGLGLGLGIPVVLGIFIYLYLHILREYSISSSVSPISSLVNPNASLNPYQELSETAYADFSFNILSDTLKRELMTIRLRKGRNLTEFVSAAQAKNSFDVATWIDRMNPGEFPRDIHIDVTS